MRTQINSDNRRRDAARLSVTHPSLREGGGDTWLYEKGTGVLLSKGYARIVFGDHGPYIELAYHHLNESAFTRWKYKCSRAYYHEGYTQAGTMLYVQVRDVRHLPNPPAGRWSVRNNRADGYADYRPGYFYLDPEKVYC